MVALVDESFVGGLKEGFTGVEVEGEETRWAASLARSITGEEFG